MSAPAVAPAAVPRSLLDAVRERVRYLQYSLRTEQAYVHWVRAFVRFHGLRHPRAMGKPEVESFLTWLSSERGVSVATHRQALAAVLFLYQQVLRHGDVSTTMIYTHVLKVAAGGTRSLLDALPWDTTRRVHGPAACGYAVH